MIEAVAHASSALRGIAAKATRFISRRRARRTPPPGNAASRRPGTHRRGSPRARSTSRRSCGGSSVWRIAARLPQTIETSGRTASTPAIGRERPLSKRRTAASSTPALTSRHVRGHRHARALVGVRRPRMEGHDRRLEEERRDHEQCCRRRDRVGRSERRARTPRAPASAPAVEQRRAHQQRSASPCRRAPGT